MFFEAITRLIHTVWNANRDEEFLEHQGEVCVRESLKFRWISSFLGESKFKMILLRQVFSGLLGVTAVSENVQVTGQHLRQILAEFWFA